jgi:hypothetical protein
MKPGVSVLGGILDALLSTRTALWLLLVEIGFFVAGAVLMPVLPSYGTMNASALFYWLGAAPLRATWWLWGAIGVLILLTLNTLVCSLDSLMRKREGRRFLLIISPQIIHAGFLLLLLAHLVSAAGAAKQNVLAREGSRFRLPGGTTMVVRDVDVAVSSEGFPLDWRATVAYYKAGRALKEDVVGPNRPSFHEGIGVYIQDVRPGAVLLLLSREPGAPWALAGAVLFTLGTLLLLALKILRE